LASRSRTRPGQVAQWAPALRREAKSAAPRRPLRRGRVTHRRAAAPWPVGRGGRRKSVPAPSVLRGARAGFSRHAGTSASASLVPGSRRRRRRVPLRKNRGSGALRLCLAPCAGARRESSQRRATRARSLSEAGEPCRVSNGYLCFVRHAAKITNKQTNARHKFLTFQGLGWALAGSRNSGTNLELKGLQALAGSRTQDNILNYGAPGPGRLQNSRKSSELWFSGPWPAPEFKTKY